jgi:hypothetical protein
MLDLDRHRGRDRVLLLIAPHAGHAALRRQLDDLSAGRRDLADREVHVVQAIGTDGEAGELRRAYRVGPGEFRAVLLGKDGTAKMIRPEPVSTADLCGAIDGMPLRRAEARA